MQCLQYWSPYISYKSLYCKKDHVRSPTLQALRIGPWGRQSLDSMEKGKVRLKQVVRGKWLY